MLVPLRGSWRLCWPLLEGLGGFPNDNRIRFGGALSAKKSSGRAPKGSQKGSEMVWEKPSLDDLGEALRIWKVLRLREVPLNNHVRESMSWALFCSVC